MPAPVPARLDLHRLRFYDTVELGQMIREFHSGAVSQSAAAQRLVDYLFDTFRNPKTEERDLALVRCFMTQRLSELPARLRQAALSALEAPLPAHSAPDVRCLTLVATRGIKEEWSRIEASAGHQAIPLPDLSMIERAPMIAALFSQLGVDAAELLSPATGSLVLDRGQQSFNVFHVPEALGSAMLPAQQTFVEPFGIRSVVGLGGLMPSGELFAVILFSRVPVSRDVAELFRTLALSVKLMLLAFPATQVFAE